MFPISGQVIQIPRQEIEGSGQEIITENLEPSSDIHLPGYKNMNNNL